jgi:hypothetical protein
VDSLQPRLRVSKYGQMWCTPHCWGQLAAASNESAAAAVGKCLRAQAQLKGTARSSTHNYCFLGTGLGAGCCRGLLATSIWTSLLLGAGLISSHDSSAGIQG